MRALIDTVFEEALIYILIPALVFGACGVAQPYFL